MGLGGGGAEIVVVWLYSAMTGGDAANVARGVAFAVGLDGTSATAGLVIHMGLAVVLGIFLSVGAASFVGLVTKRALFALPLGSLAVVWLINFFVILPELSSGFVHLLPYVVSLASKLAFGCAASVVAYSRNASSISARSRVERNALNSRCGAPALL